MRRVIILSLLSVSVFLLQLKLDQKVVGPVSGRPVKHNLSLLVIKKQVEVIHHEGRKAL